MADMRLGAVETRFADLIWENEPISSGELVKLCEQELSWKKSTTYTILRRLSQFSLMGLFPAPTTETGRIEYVSLNMLHTERPAITVDVPASDLSQTADNPAEPPIADVAAAGSLDVLVSMASIVFICGVV